MITTSEDVKTAEGEDFHRVNKDTCSEFELRSTEFLAASIEKDQRRRIVELAWGNPVR